MTHKITVGLLSLCLGASAWAIGPKDKDEKIKIATNFNAPPKPFNT